MSEQGIDVNQPTRWVNTCNSYDVPPLTKWQHVKSVIPWRLRCFLHWLWYGHEFWPTAQWVKWNGPPPCRIARLWRRTPR